jgi:hypothetical protein
MILDSTRADQVPAVVPRYPGHKSIDVRGDIALEEGSPLLGGEDAVNKDLRVRMAHRRFSLYRP